MTVSQAQQRLNDRWRQFYENARLPAACVFCEGTKLWWNGTRVRSASVLCEGEVVHLSEVPCRRIKCGTKGCNKSWTQRPEGLTPQRHYQLDVVAEGSSRYLFSADGTLSGVAEQMTCSRHTVRRWIRWLSAIVTVGVLLRLLVEHTDEPAAPRVHEVAQPGRKAQSGLVQAVLSAAAGVLCVLEALATAAGLPAPGLSSVVQAVVADRYRVTTYARPFIPDFARCRWLRPAPPCGGELGTP